MPYVSAHFASCFDRSFRVDIGLQQFYGRRGFSHLLGERGWVLSGLACSFFIRTWPASTAVKDVMGHGFPFVTANATSALYPLRVSTIRADNHRVTICFFGFSNERKLAPSLGFLVSFGRYSKPLGIFDSETAPVFRQDGSAQLSQGRMRGLLA